MLEKNKTEINGNDNNVEQIDKQVNYYLNGIPVSFQSVSYVPDKYASELLKAAVEDEQNPRIMFVKTLGGNTIQCGSCKLSISSTSKTEREMSYWEDALKNLERYGYIEDVGYKGEVFKVTKKGYEFYDSLVK